MIATSASTDVLRHGWLDAAATLAPDIPEIADLLGARLNDAIASGRLSEGDLLDTIAEVEATASRVGSSSGPLLARRLRRTVYEYLLALDANTAVDAQAAARIEAEAEAAAVDEEPAAVPAEPPTAAADPPMADDATSPPLSVPDDFADAGAVFAEFDDAEPAGADDEALEIRRRRFGFRRRQGGGEPRRTDNPDGDDDLAWLQELPSLSTVVPPVAPPGIAPTGPVDASPTVETAAVAAAAEPAESAPATGPHIEPDVLDAAAHPEAAAAAVDDAPAPTADEDATPLFELHVEPDLADAATADEPHDDGDVSSPAVSAADEPEIGMAPEGDAAEDVRFVAPRAGFHIVEDTDPAHVPEPPESAAAAMVFRSSGAANGHTETDAAAESLHEADSADPAPGQPPAPPAMRVPDPAVDDMLDPASWRVRHPTAEARRSAAARGDSGLDPAEQPEDPFESDPRLFDLRRKIQDRLRRKRCDEAAALLQLLAQETGGRAIAELAMDAGDRCRGLGKNNAALNCYLAASRADPVFELPLSRLADICIDDQDIDLAVSYLERIARLHRMRGDEKAALRVYRRVVTVAPYREDILAMLMNARNNGGIDV